MLKAQLITIGTEITSGEVVNTNAAWVSLRLEEKGVRVFSHFTVRDQADEIFKALNSSPENAICVVTGGLGPTSDDITRECMARHFAEPLEFSQSAWSELQETHNRRGLLIREAHKHQCYFPRGCEILKNPVGTAHGFTCHYQGRQYFVLPGPPRELEGMWNAEVEPRLIKVLPPNPFRWKRWTCLGVPESEVAELVENVIAGSDLEVGYRATVPYVKVKLYIDEDKLEHRAKAEDVDLALQPFLVGRDFEDLAEELLNLWPEPILRLVDQVTEANLIQRLFAARSVVAIAGASKPMLEIAVNVPSVPIAGIDVSKNERGDFTIHLRVPGLEYSETLTLPYKVSLESERGKRSAAEWVLWTCVKALKAASRHN